MNTTLSASGTQNHFTAINFSDQNHVSLSADDSLSLTCERAGTQTDTPETPGTPPSANQSLSYGGVTYPLTNGFEEAFRFRPTQGNDTHSSSDFAVANAAFVQTTLFPIGGLPTQVIWRPTNATAWLWATLYSPGGNGFDSSFDVTLENGVPVSGSFSGVFPLFDHSL